MKIARVPFHTTDGSAVEATEHRGEAGVARWRTVEQGNVRVRMAECSPRLARVRYRPLLMFASLALFAACAGEERDARVAAPHVCSDPTPGAVPVTGPSAAAATPTASSTPATVPGAAGGPPPLAYEIARSLADEVGPRPVGSPHAARAVDWAVATMERLGLENVHTEPVTAPAWQRGVEQAEMTAPAPQRLAVTALGWSPATRPTGIEAEIVEVDSIEALDARGEAAVKGKIVFFNRAIPRRRDGSGYGDGARLRFAGPLAAAKLGAVAVLVRSVGTDHDRFAHTGATSREVTLPSGAVSIPDADMLHRTIASGKPVRVRLVLTPRTVADVKTANVVGDVVGSSKPDEIVLLGAHLDSWDLGTGAVDDGAGCGIVLATADAIRRGPRPARTVRVVLFAAEESSGAGADAYAKAHAAEVDRHVLALEADTGTGAAWALRFTGEPEHQKRFLEAEALVRAFGVVAETAPAFGGSDIGPLRALGVPVADVRQDMTRYFDVHHTANDTVAELDPGALAQVTATFAAVTRFAADEPKGFGRVPEAMRKGH